MRRERRHVRRHEIRRNFSPEISDERWAKCAESRNRRTIGGLHMVPGGGAVGPLHKMSSRARARQQHPNKGVSLPGNSLFDHALPSHLTFANSHLHETTSLLSFADVSAGFQGGAYKCLQSTTVCSWALAKRRPTNRRSRQAANRWLGGRPPRAFRKLVSAPCGGLRAACCSAIARSADPREPIAGRPVLPCSTSLRRQWPTARTGISSRIDRFRVGVGLSQCS